MHQTSAVPRIRDPSLIGDLKLEKILIDSRFSPVIADIDISVPNNDKRVSATLVWSRGNVDYMAPENLPPASLPMSLSSDMYAFGICLLKALGLVCIRNTETGVHNVPQCGEDEGLEELLGHVLCADPRQRIPAARLMHHEFFEYADEAGEELVFENIRAVVEEANSTGEQQGFHGDSPVDDDVSVASRVSDGVALPGMAKADARRRGGNNVRCVMCNTDVGADDGITCHAGHFTCEKCFGRFVDAETAKSISERRWMEIQSKFDNKKSYIRRTAAAIKSLYPEIKVDALFEEDPWSDLKVCEKWFTVTDFFLDRQCIVCPSHVLCKGAPFADADVVRHISAEQNVNFSLARDELVEWRLTCISQSAVTTERNRILNLTDIDDAVEEARLHIVNSVMPLICPRCGTERTECLNTYAAVCKSCRCGFCSLCCHDCGDDATSHVLHCEYNSTGCLYVSEDDFKDAQKARQDRMVHYYLQTLTEEIREQMGVPHPETAEDEQNGVVVISEDIYQM